VRLSDAGWVLAVCMVAMVGGAIVAAGLLLGAYQRGAERVARIEQQGIPAEATVVEAGPLKGSPKRRTIVYRYTAAGQTWEGRVRLRRRDSQRVAMGSVVPIRYLSSEPARSWMLGYEPRGSLLWVAVLLPSALVLGTVPLAMLLRRQWNLLEEGRVIEARVVASRKVDSGEGSHFEVEYEFRILSGALRRVKLAASKKPVEGTPATLIYDRDNPNRVARYPLSLVRAR
jgi:hypothetical protein